MLAVILDMDGLMLDTEPIAQRAWKLAATHYGQHWSDETCRAMIGLTVTDCKPILLSHFGRDFPFDELEALARANYTARLPKVVIHSWVSQR